MSIPPGHGFPGNRTDLQSLADAWDIVALREHAWDLWGGLTADSGQDLHGMSLPIWETWCGTADVFGRTCDLATAPSRGFMPPNQDSHSDIEVAQNVVAFNKYNPAMAEYIERDHGGPGGGIFNYFLQGDLADLNDSWPSGTTNADRSVEQAPYVAPSGTEQGLAAAELKPVLFLVKADQLTPVPLWRSFAGSNDPNCSTTDGELDTPSECHPAFNTWTSCVLLDPDIQNAPTDTPPIPATSAQIDSRYVFKTAAGADLYGCETFFYAPLNTIYSFELDANAAKEFNTAQFGADGAAVAGDYAVLTGMHVSTKEIANWGWQTFWWQPTGPDLPSPEFPGSTADMTAGVTGFWRNYAACTAYAQTKGADSSEVHVCFNPFLETSAGIPDGVQSNCMSCHGMAAVGSPLDSDGNAPSLDYPSHYDGPIDFDTDPVFDGYTSLDFLWSLAGNAKPSK